MKQKTGKKSSARFLITGLVLTGLLAVGMFILFLNSGAIAVDALQSNGYEYTEYDAEVVDKYYAVRRSGLLISAASPVYYLVVSIDGFSGEAPICVTDDTFDEVGVGDVVVCGGYTGPSGDLKRLEYVEPTVG